MADDDRSHTEDEEERKPCKRQRIQVQHLPPLPDDAVPEPDAPPFEMKKYGCVMDCFNEIAPKGMEYDLRKKKTCPIQMKAKQMYFEYSAFYLSYRCDYAKKYPIAYRLHLRQHGHPDKPGFIRAYGYHSRFWEKVDAEEKKHKEEQGLSTEETADEKRKKAAERGELIV